ncbi:MULTISPECIES: hypothetical protein [unclassified Roseovarius]|uniref:hypothetical protein n=1 Tax=unclassified Roseovarius TaxID=2614913 RepID=UPI00273E3140|nr:MULTISPECIES: hypothetical protein [unclassified Roseovarius]
MRTDKLQLSDVRYNPERSAFEAIIRVHDRGETYEYPTHLVAPLQAEFALIARGLVEKAHRAHKSASPALRMRKAVAPVQTVNRPAPQLRETPLMMRMLRALAA